MRKKVYMIFLLLLCTCWNVQAQTNETSKNSIHQSLTFHLFDVESGLSNNYINSIEEDDLGRIWIATSDGLNSYDGSIVEHYKTNHNKGLTNNNIPQIFFDYKNKKMLLATDNGMNIYDPVLELFKPLVNTTDSLTQMVNCFTKNASGKLFLSILRSKEGLYLYNDAQELLPYSTVFERYKEISSTEISSLAMQHDSILWIGTFHSGLLKLNLNSANSSKLTTIPTKFSSTINTIFVDDSQHIWIGSKEGLSLITNQQDTLQLSSSSNYEKGLSDKSVLSIEEDNQGRIWIGTRNGGLNILNKTDFIEQKKLNIKWYLPKYDGTSVYNRTVSCIKKDHNGNMWLGTSTGVNFVNPNNEPVQLIQHSITNSNGLSHNRIGSLALAKDNKIWIGTDGGGLDLLDPATNTFAHFRHDDSIPNSLSNNYIISVLEDSKNRVWVGTYQGGINLLNPATRLTKKYLPNEDIREIFEDAEGQIWVAANRAGLFVYSTEKDEYKYIETLGKIDIRDIKQGKDNSLWLATFGDGIIQFFPEKNKTISYTTNTVSQLPTNVFFSIEPLKDNRLLIGSRYEGLILLDPSTKAISRFTEKDGLSNNSVVSIVKENDEFYWLGTNNGINRYSVKSNKTYNLSTLNNIQTSAFNINSALRSSDGNLYFGGNKGLNIFYPERLQNVNEDYKLLFNKLTVLNTPVDISTENTNAVLQKSISYADAIYLNHQQSLFSIGYTLLKYPKAKNIRYSYMLEGFQDQWIETYGTSEANFSKTPPGKYLLKVKANLDSGQEITHQIAVVISPPFWKTLPAYFLYFIIVSILIYLGMSYYTERVKLKNSLIFEKKQRQLEHDLNEERMHFFTNFSHELKTPLTLILAPLDDLIKQSNADKKLQSLLIIKKNAEILYRYIQRLLDFRKSETGHSQLNLQQYNLYEVLQQIENSFKPLTNKKGIQLTAKSTSKEVYACIDLEKFQIIINNLISNAIKHTKKGGAIHIDLDMNSESFKVQVKDTGTGIDKKDIPFIFNWYYQAGSTRKKGTGVGLALTKNYVELHKGKIIVSNNAPFPGVTFTLELPVNQHLFSTLKQSAEQVTLVQNEEVASPPLYNYETQDKPKNFTINTARKLVLLVDDNEDILTYLESLLVVEYDLIFAKNGQEGIFKALEYVPDIIVSDVMMPEKTGVELCHELKNNKATSHIPIILLTAKGNTNSVKTGYEEGADDYITKPFNNEILTSRIKNLLKNRENLQQYFTTQEPLNTKLSSSNQKLIDKEKKFLMDLKSYILENLKQNEDFSVESIAKEVGMSRSSLYRKINAMTGGNINDFIRKVKLEKAAFLIKQEGLTISQASYEVGFNSVNYFRKIFKKEYGALPSDFREGTGEQK